MKIMKLAIFGGTGRTGRLLVQQALERGYEVVALARNPASLDIQHDALTVMAGDIQDAAQVEAVISGADVVLSVLGPASNTPDYVVSKGTKNIITAMHNHGVRRLIISIGAGVSDPNDEPKLINRAISFLLHLVSKHVVEDMTRVANQVRESGLDWTIVRVPMLHDGPKTGEVRVGYVGKGTGARLTRADMAAFMLAQVETSVYLQQAPVISN